MFTQKNSFHALAFFLIGLLSLPGLSARAASANVAVGQTVVLSATVDGTAPFTYQWYKDGVILSGATASTYQITGFQAANVGVYSTVVANSAGSAASDNATLSFVGAPLFTMQPTGQTVTAGAGVTFSAAASGTPAPTYQWRKDGVNITGATSTSYTIVTTAASDAGTYAVVATNAAGSATSTGAVLTVNAANTAPTISAIADQTTGLGAAVGPISFVVGDTQTAAGSLAVTGGSSNLTLVPVGNIVFGGSGANRTVTLTPASGQSGTSTITVTASDGALTKSTSFVLTVSTIAPTTQTVSNTVAMTIPDAGPASVYPSNITLSGLGGTISAVALSLNNFNHSWASDVDVMLVSPTGKKIMLMSKSGGGGSPTTNATLTFSTTATATLPQMAALVTGTYQPTSDGTSTIVFPAPAPAAPYDTTFAGLIGQTANGVWSLYVVDGWQGDQGTIIGGWTLTVTTTGSAQVAPTISNISNQATTTGTAIAAIPFTVGDADTALGSLTLSGASSNTTLVPAGNIIFGGSGANRTVTITPAAGQTGTATITVTVSDGSLTATDTFVVTVSAPLTAPLFTAQPATQTVTAGASVSFTAFASGNPAPTYQWRKNGTNITGATTASYSIAGTTAADAGTYAVVATNSVGSATSSGAVLTVNAATSVPAITSQPVSQTVTAGTSVTFSVAASGNPAPSYQWRKNGAAIAGATSASYTIGSTVVGDAATYTVVATNSVGSATSSGAVLTVNAATSAPVITTHPVSQTVTRSSPVTLKVVASGTPALTYQWKKNGSKINGATGSSFTMASVATGSAGTYTVVVTNSSGSVTSNGAVLAVKNTTAPVIYRVDFNGDGKSDIIWQNSTTAACSVWLMNGTTVTSKVSLGNGPAGLKIGGTGDFNNDGKTDILWQNVATGEARVWLMAGTTLVSDASLGTVSTDWQLRGSGDFNGDGKSDLVWQNSVTDECSVWLMNGTTVGSVVSLGQAPADLMITGAGDFNKDGQSDLLWQNDATGEYGVWLMAGATVSSSVSLGTVTLDWQLCGTGDYNADLRSDLLWQNLLTGESSVWLMNSSMGSSSKVSLGVQSIDWILRN